jgi:2-polyprenyl-3-methyl-5-hydroxy-6-metoxy-1,4-benzoquinol methylase
VLPPLDDLLARLERERLDADRRYNDALTALDGAIQRPPALPDLPGVESGAPHALNESWNILRAGPPPFDRTLKGRVRAFVWALVGPLFRAQSEFNASVVAHANRIAARSEQVAAVLADTLAAVRAQFEALERFESLLVQYLQTITAYVDTKDRSLGGADLRHRLALTEQRVLAVKRELEMTGDRRIAREPAAAAAFAADVDAPAYAAFEDQFRGAKEDVRERVQEYVPLFASASDVLDVGCGRGELLEALRAQGVRARGIDMNAAMVERCRSRGLDVVQADALAGLQQIADDGLGGLVAIQVVEHFEPAYLIRFLETAYHKMRAGAPLVLETINPAGWMAFVETYLRDLTHQRPLHPDTLKYLVEASGFSRTDVQFRRPVRDVDRLMRATPAAAGARFAPEQAELAAVLNDHADKLNARLFSSMDYVVVARR